jgi:hypothetical protein
MKAPKTKLGQFVLGFVTELICFFIVVSNTRAFTHGNYTWTIITDTLFSMQNFAMAKLMMDDSNARTWYMGAGYTIGGAIGSCLAILATSHLGF